MGEAVLSDDCGYRACSRMQGMQERIDDAFCRTGFEEENSKGVEGTRMLALVLLIIHSGTGAGS